MKNLTLTIEGYEDLMAMATNMAIGYCAVPLFLWWFPDFLRWFSEKSVTAIVTFPNFIGVIPMVVFVLGLAVCFMFVMGVRPLSLSDDSETA